MPKGHIKKMPSLGILDNYRSNHIAEPGKIYEYEFGIPEPAYNQLLPG